MYNDRQADKTSLEQKFERLRREVLEDKQFATDAKHLLTISRNTWSTDRKTLEDTIVELFSSCQSSPAIQEARKAAALAQFSRVKEAEEKYNCEVLPHADTLR